MSFAAQRRQRSRPDRGAPHISFGGQRVDAAVSAEVLSVVRPPGIEAATWRTVKTHRSTTTFAPPWSEIWGPHGTPLRVPNQYDAADPENRLVADELEKRWNQALARVREIAQRVANHDNARGADAAQMLQEFSALAERLELLWEHTHTDPRLKKRIVRSLIHEVVVDVDAAAAEVVLVIH